MTVVYVPPEEAQADEDGHVINAEHYLIVVVELPILVRNRFIKDTVKKQKENNHLFTLPACFIQKVHLHHFFIINIVYRIELNVIIEHPFYISLLLFRTPFNHTIEDFTSL